MSNSLHLDAGESALFHFLSASIYHPKMRVFLFLFFFFVSLEVLAFLCLPMDLKLTVLMT